jgi:hypothetical protein
MQENGADLLFPPYVISGLRNLRGSAWQDLVDRVNSIEYLAEERLSFVLMMVHLGGCITCQADSYKAMRGCALCSALTIKRFRGNDQDLLNKFAESKIELYRYSQEDSNGIE